MDVLYGTSSYGRERGNFPYLPVINMFAEKIGSETQMCLLSRPGLTRGSAVGSGPIRSLFKAFGVLSNSLFVVSGHELYRDGVLVGSIDGNDAVSIAGYTGYLFIAAGASLWGYDGTTLSTITVPDDLPVSKVVVGASRVVVSIKSTQKFFWTEPLGITIDSLSFASAEKTPSNILDLLYLGDVLIIFKQDSVEFWPSSTDDNLPFLPQIGKVFELGSKNDRVVSKYKDGFAWITQHNKVCVNTPENIISFPELEVRINSSSTLVMWRFYLDSTEYLAITLDTETWVFNSLGLNLNHMMKLTGLLLVMQILLLDL